MIISNIFILQKCFLVSIMALTMDPENIYSSLFFLCTMVLILKKRKTNRLHCLKAVSKLNLNDITLWNPHNSSAM